MMLWTVILLMIAGTAAIMLWPLMRTRAAQTERRAILIAMIAVLVLLPAGAMIVYAYLGAPELTGKIQSVAETEGELAAEAAEATRAAHNNPGVEAYNHLGNILFRMGNYEAASKAYKAAARLGGAGKN